MGFLTNLRIEMTKQDFSTLLRILNERLVSIRNAVNLNFAYAYAQVQEIIDSNGTWTFWIPSSDYEIESWILCASAVTTNPDVDLIVNGSTVDSQTLSDTAVHEYALSPVEVVTRLQKVQVAVSSLTSGEVVTVSCVVRRTADVV